GVKGTGGEEDDFSALTTWAGQRRLQSLSLRRMDLPDGPVARLLGSDRLAGLRRLELSPMLARAPGPRAPAAVGPRACQALARNDRLAATLRELCLSYLSDGDAAVRALAGADWRLLRLSLTAYRAEAGVRELTRAPWFAGLRRLEVSGSPAA